LDDSNGQRSVGHAIWAGAEAGVLGEFVAANGLAEAAP
jgi:hypothetical protein